MVWKYDRSIYAAAVGTARSSARKRASPPFVWVFAWSKASRKQAPSGLSPPARISTPPSYRDSPDEAQLNQRDLSLLAFSGSLKEVAGNRHQARWQVLGIESSPPLLAGNTFPEGTPMLPVPSEGQALVEDYAVFGFTLGPHPLALLRHHLERMRMVDARQLQSLEHGQPVRTSGLVVNRQRPSTASGVVFITLEDETGHINLVLWPWVTQKQRDADLERAIAGCGRGESNAMETSSTWSPNVSKTTLIYWDA